MKEDTPTLEQLITFCILMENNGGILHKAPAYVFEKYRLAVGLKQPEALLDPHNLAKFNTYMATWAGR